MIHTSARTEYPQFAELTAGEFAQLLAMSKLSSAEKEIATQCVVWHMCYADIEPIVYMSRWTIARKMKRIILPELERMQKKMKAEA